MQEFESSSGKEFEDEKSETSDSELSDFLDEINTDMLVFGDEEHVGGFEENVGESIRERLFSWSSSSLSSESEEDPFCDVFQGETESLMGNFPTFEVRVESPIKMSKKKRKRLQKSKSAKKKRKLNSSDDEPNARRDIALKRKRKMGRFVESEWEFVPISKVL